MTPYGAVARLQRLAPQEHRLLCTGCAEALLAEIGALFASRDTPHTVRLSGCDLLGCTFDVGTEQECTLHRLLGQDEGGS